jgi:hypothetical protein
MSVQQQSETLGNFARFLHLSQCPDIFVILLMVLPSMTYLSLCYFRYFRSWPAPMLSLGNLIPCNGSVPSRQLA